MKNTRTQSSEPQVQRSMNNGRLWSARTALGALVLTSGLALALGSINLQDGSVSLDESIAVDEPVSLSAVEANEVLAAHLSRVALLDLGLQDSPAPADYELVANLLSIASGLDPTNAELARSVVEASWSAGNLEMMLDATRQVIMLDPRDTVAQLRLVSSVINKQQTVDGRLRLYDRFLGEAGRSLDASVRSQLALDAALLEREQGNTRGFVERLQLSTRLDISHKAAASLAAQFYSDVASEPLTVLDYQFKLLYADPLDPNVHLVIARLLAAEGAFVPARRFLSNAITLHTLFSGRAPSGIDQIRIALDWQLDGPSEMLKDLNTIIEGRRAEAQARIDSYIEEQLPTEDLIKPEDILYDLGTDKLRLLASFNLGDQDATRKVLEDIERTVSREIDSVNTQMNMRGANQSALLSRLVSTFADFQVLRAISGLELDRIETDVNQMVAKAPVLKSYFTAMTPMILFSKGLYAEAIADIEARSASPVFGLIKGLSHEKLGQPELAIESYTVIVHENALDAYGAFAQSRLVELGVGDKTLTPIGRSMVRSANTIPSWLDQMITRPTSFMHVDLVSSADRVDALENPVIRIRLKNLSPIPLAVGSVHPIDSRFLMMSRLNIQSTDFVGEPSSKVVSVDHRIRLNPLEEMVVEVSADSPQTQWLLKMQANTTLQQRYRAIQGFRPRTSDEILAMINPDSDAAIYGIVNSPLGLIAETELVQRMVLSESSYSVDQLVEQLASGDEQSRRRAVLASAGRLTLPSAGQEFDLESQRRLVGALMDVYTNAKSSERARMILLLPHRHQAPEMIGFDDHVVGLIVSDALIDSRVDPIVFACALLTRTDAADSPIFDVLDQAQDPRLIRIAGIIRARLEASISTMSTIGPGVESMIPEKANFGF